LNQIESGPALTIELRMRWHEKLHEAAVSARTNTLATEGVYVKKSTIGGFGLFTGRDFAKGEVVVEYEGVASTRPRDSRTESDTHVARCGLWQPWTSDGLPIAQAFRAGAPPITSQITVPVSRIVQCGKGASITRVYGHGAPQELHRKQVPVVDVGLGVLANSSKGTAGRRATAKIVWLRTARVEAALPFRGFLVATRALGPNEEILWNYPWV
jgi:hypothetical protein